MVGPVVTSFSVDTDYDLYHIVHLNVYPSFRIHPQLYEIMHGTRFHNPKLSNEPSN